VLFTKSLFTGNTISAKSGNPKLVLKSSSTMNMGGTLNKLQRLMVVTVLSILYQTITKPENNHKNYEYIGNIKSDIIICK